MHISSHFAPEGGTQAMASPPSHADCFQADLRRNQRLCHLHVLQAQPVQQKYHFLNILISNTNSVGSFCYWNRKGRLSWMSLLVSSNSMHRKEFLIQSALRNTIICDMYLCFKIINKWCNKAKAQQLGVLRRETIKSDIESGNWPFWIIKLFTVDNLLCNSLKSWKRDLFVCIHPPFFGGFNHLCQSLWKY